MSERLKTVFMGTPELAVPALQCLAALSDVQCVLTQPDRKAGRGKQLRPPPVKVAAEALGIPVWQPETLRGQSQAAQLQGADLFVVLAYGEILRQAVLDLPRIDCINLHGSLLPRWRGASPLQACIRAGDTETGVSVMSMVRALDAGPVYYEQSFALGDQARLAVLHDQMASCAAEALAYYLHNYASLTAVAQDESRVTYCGKLNAVDGHLDFHGHSAQEIERWVRGYTPAPGCWVEAEEMRLRILDVLCVDAPVDLQPAQVHVEGRRALVGCQQGAVELLVVQVPGKKPARMHDYLNGRSLPTVFA